jgi:hypothetical protein
VTGSGCWPGPVGKAAEKDYCQVRRQFREQGMKKIGWKIMASIGVIAFSQIALPMLNSRGVMAAGSSASIGLLAQAAEPAASATAPAPDSKVPDPAPPTSSSPSNAAQPNPTSTAVVVKPARSVTGCGLKYLTAEISGKLKGRKWKEFRDEECGPTTSQAVFPSAVAPKYSKETPDKARTLTCADQFTANKATNANDGLKWIEKGGGYYSECVSRLKG